MVGRPPPAVRARLAAGEQPPPLTPGFHAPLADLRLPPGVRFAAAFLHEGRTPNELRRILGIVEDADGHPVDVAAACGLGRRPRTAARSVLRMAAELCETEPAVDEAQAT